LRIWSGSLSVACFCKCLKPKQLDYLYVTNVYYLFCVQGQKAADSSCSSGLTTSESISTIKRLLWEVFADHLGFKARLDSLEKAAADEAEAADDYELRMATGSSASSWARAPVRATGWFSAAGVLQWTGVSGAGSNS
jgi:hypothetical protein